MKILISNENKCAHYYERTGLLRALSVTNQVEMWHLGSKSPFDVFDEVEPEILISQAYNLTEPILKCIEERPHLRVILKAGDWGDVSDSIDKNTYPILIASETEKKAVDRLQKSGNLDFLFIHYHPDYLNQTHGHWTKLGIKVVSLMNAADIFEFTNGGVYQSISSDICFLGGYWPYKSITLDKYILPLCDKYNVKIFGNQSWPVPQYCGFLPDGAAKDVLKSAKICPNVSEPHSQVYGFDIIERPFKLLSNKCFVVSDYVEGLAKLFPEAIVYGKTPEEFQEKIEHFIKHPIEKEKHIRIGYEQVMKGHTYFDRASTIFQNLGLQVEHVKILEAKKQICKDMNL